MTNLPDNYGDDVTPEEAREIREHHGRFVLEWLRGRQAFALSELRADFEPYTEDELLDALAWAREQPAVEGSPLAQQEG
jgi:hypothetical protein